MRSWMEEGNLLIDCVMKNINEELCGRIVIIIIILYHHHHHQPAADKQRERELLLERGGDFRRILYLVRGKRNSPTNKLLLRIKLRIFYVAAMGGYTTHVVHLLVLCATRTVA